MNPITTGLLGLSVADAIGVPVEFQSRLELDKNPVKDIRGYGTYNQPPGYFSDDSSLAFGLAESLATGCFDLVDQAKRLINYKHHSSARGMVTLPPKGCTVIILMAWPVAEFQ